MKTTMTPSVETLQALESSLVALCLFLSAPLVSAQAITQLKSFPALALDPSSGYYTNDGGAYPHGRLALAGNMLFGTTPGAGGSGHGSVFRINTTGGGFAVLRDFDLGAIATSTYTNTDGAQPQSDLLVSGGTVYGVAMYGGALGMGTLFKVGTNGNGFTVLRTFAGANYDGANPSGNLVLSSGGVLYGTTQWGGTGVGTVYRVDTNGDHFAIVHAFSWATSDGGLPKAGLVLSGSTLYGTTRSGGGSGMGTVFSLNTNGTGFTVLKSFPSPDASGANNGGFNPEAQLELAGGRLYGTTTHGGASTNGTVFAINTDGSAFTVLHDFSALQLNTYGTATNSDGANPSGSLVCLGNKLYGTTQYGGGTGSGTIFEVTTNGSGFKVIWTFDQNYDGGGVPAAGLLLSGSTFYGTTQFGGDSSAGTVFSLPVPGPQLNITRAGANVILSWPSDDIGLTLQSTPNLGPSAVWSSNPPAPVVVSDRYTVTNSASAGARFYRLTRQ